MEAPMLTADDYFTHPRLAGVYDLVNPHADDTDFYAALPGSRPCRILDLGCGTGTLACQCAVAGHRVTGVDPSSSMLDVARGKPGGERVQWVKDRAETFRTSDRFEWVFMTGHAMQLFLDDDSLLEVLVTMRRHLASGGRVAFETRNPARDWVGAWQGWSRRDWDTLAQEFPLVEAEGERVRFVHQFVFPDETITVRRELRFPPRPLLHGLARAAGLVITREFGSWDAQPFTESSHEMIFVLEASSPTSQCP
jgi:ubiquinone/menaquinone biosynthesis C-methylase UbiE